MGRTETRLPDQLTPRSGALSEVVALALKLGFTAFGGPAAHIAMLRSEVVDRRKWITDERFLDLLGATNLIPGPNSTEMVIHVGYLRAGWRGLLLAGVCFILPAMMSVMALAWGYVRYGTTPQAGWLLYGIKPVIIAVILQALVSLGRKAVKGRLTAAVGVIAVGLYLIGFNEILLMIAGGMVVMLVENTHRLRIRGAPGLAITIGLTLPALVTGAAARFSLTLLFLNFLKIGAVLYGSGYVLLAFMQSDFVTRLGWLTDQQLIDAIAVGQLTPGPVFTTATFAGYILGGVSGALVATLGIFTPSFLFVLLSNPLIPRIRSSPWSSGLLDGVNVAALALMAVVTWRLGRSAIVDPMTAAVAIASAVLLFRFRVNAFWLVLGGGLTGWLSATLL